MEKKREKLLLGVAVWVGLLGPGRGLLLYFMMCSRFWLKIFFCSLWSWSFSLALFVFCNREEGVQFFQCYIHLPMVHKMEDRVKGTVFHFRYRRGC